MYFFSKSSLLDLYVWQLKFRLLWIKDQWFWVFVLNIGHLVVVAFAHCFQLVLNDGIMTDQILDANLLSFVENSLFIKNLDSNFLMLVMLVLYYYQLALWREHQRYADYVFGSLLDFATAASYLLVIYLCMPWLWSWLYLLSK